MYSLDYVAEETETPARSSSARKHSRSDRTEELSDYEEATPGQYNDAEEDEAVHDDNHHLRKRQCNEDWPLKSTGSALPPSLVSLQSKPFNSRTVSRRNEMHSARPSKFQEGSMNDRTSEKPPSIYMTEENRLDRCLQESAAASERTAESEISGAEIEGRPSRRPISQSTVKSSASRQSSIFRFGKSIASAFNPANWGNKATIWKPSPEQDPHLKLMEERRFKAEKAYQELKENGQIGPSTHKATPFVASFSGRFPRSETRRDSGIDVGRDSSSKERRREEETPIDSNMGSAQKSASDFSDNSAFEPPTQRKAYFLRRASLPSLRISRSDLRSSSINADNMMTPTPLPDSARVGPGGPTLHSQVSKKDLRKQRKLAKKVSDLEGKLEAARRQLLAMGDEPIPPLPSAEARKPFVPGALPSVPSERILMREQQLAEIERPDKKLDQTETSPIPADEEFNSAEGPKYEPTKSSPEEIERPKLVLKLKLKQPLSMPKSFDDDSQERDSHHLENVSEEVEQSTTPIKLHHKPQSGKRKTSDDIGHGPDTEQAKEITPQKRVQTRRNGSKIPRSLLDTNEAASLIETGDIASVSTNTSLGSPGMPRMRLLAAPRSAKSNLPRYRASSPPPFPFHYSNPAGLTGPRRSVRSSDPKNSRVNDYPISITPDNVSIPPVPQVPRGLKKMIRLAEGKEASSPRGEDDYTTGDKEGDVEEEKDNEDRGVDVDPKKKSMPMSPPLHMTPIMTKTERQRTSASLVRVEKEDYEWPEDVF
ncbi:MAG: hypothetical protein M1819_001577 [Sarea resinae]|nr:MAG: hypothetical protein M1819_001577 [Sarea resinae]